MIKSFYFKTLFISAVILFSTSIFAASELECKRRVLTAMENAKVLGGDQKDEEQFGSIAANDCLREAHSVDKNAYESSEGPGFWSFFGLALTLGVLFIFFSYGSDAKEELENKRDNMDPEEIERVASMRRSMKIRDSLGEKIGAMTIDEIANATESSIRSTVSWLRRNGLSCKDFDGVACKAQRKQDETHEDRE